MSRWGAPGLPWGGPGLWWRRMSTWTRLGLVVVGLTACDGAPPPAVPEPATAPSAAPSAAPGARSSRIAQPEVAGTGAPSAALSVASETVSPPKAALAAPTPGKIACGQEACDAASQVCCLHGGGRNTPSCFAPPAGKRPYWAGCGREFKRCDESSDCPDGKVCCIAFDDTSGGGMEYSCEDGPCPAGAEACIPGGSCRQKDYECRGDIGTAMGQCAFVQPPVRCGKEVCPTATPLCCIDRKLRNSVCVSSKRCASKTDPEDWDEEPDFPHRVELHCRSRADCGGNYCAIDSYGMGCSPMGAPWVNDIVHCVSPQRAYRCGSTILCETTKDCPSKLSGQGSGPERRLVVCAPSRDLPPWLKSCRYQEGSGR